MFCVDATLKSNLKNRLDLPKSRYFENFLFGTVMGFTFSKEKNQNEKKYHMDSALIESNDVNVLSVWHIVGINGELISTGKCSCFYIDMKN